MGPSSWRESIMSENLTRITLLSNNSDSIMCENIITDGLIVLENIINIIITTTYNS